MAHTKELVSWYYDSKDVPPALIQSVVSFLMFEKTMVGIMHVFQKNLALRSLQISKEASMKI